MGLSSGFYFIAHEFPATYETVLRKIQRLLFHVVAHLYHRHFRELLLLGLHSHLHGLFAHLILFNSRFRLIDDKETEILNDLVIALRLQTTDDGAPSFFCVFFFFLLLLLIVYFYIFFFIFVSLLLEVKGATPTPPVANSRSSQPSPQPLDSASASGSDPTTATGNKSHFSFIYFFFF